MKILTLKISDACFSRLRSAHAAKGITGNMFGVQDEIVERIIKAIEDEQPELELKLKHEGEAS